MNHRSERTYLYMSRTAKLTFAVIAGIGIPLLLIGGGLFALSMVGKNMAKNNDASNPTAGAAKAREINACEVVSASQLQEITGQAVKIDPRYGDGVPTVNMTYSNSRCYFDAVDENSFVSVSIGIDTATEADKAYTIENYERTKASNQPAPDFRPISGLGDDAFSAGSSVYLKKDFDTIKVLVTGDPDEGKMSEEVARLIVNELY